MPRGDVVICFSRPVSKTEEVAHVETSIYTPLPRCPSGQLFESCMCRVPCAECFEWFKRKVVHSGLPGIGYGKTDGGTIEKESYLSFEFSYRERQMISSYSKEESLRTCSLFDSITKYKTDVEIWQAL